MDTYSWEVELNKSELVDRVATASSVAKRDVENVVDALFDTVKNAVKGGDQVAWPGFGSFKGSQRSARTGRNPQTGAPVKIPASRGMKFTSSAALKELLNAKSPAKKATTKKASGKKAPARKAAKSSKKR
jgi:DNA-binding protein HU-beta